MEKKAKAEAKRTRRIQRKQGGDAANSLETPDGDSEASDGEPQTSDIESNTAGVESKTADESI